MKLINQFFNRGEHMKLKLVLSVLGVLAVAPTAHAEDVVRIATEGAYAPWNFLAPTACWKASRSISPKTFASA